MSTLCDVVVALGCSTGGRLRVKETHLRIKIWCMLDCSGWLEDIAAIKTINHHCNSNSKVRVVIAWLSDSAAGLRGARDQRQAMVAKCVSAVQDLLYDIFLYVFFVCSAAVGAKTPLLFTSRDPQCENNPRMSGYMTVWN